MNLEMCISLIGHYTQPRVHTLGWVATKAGFTYIEVKSFKLLRSRRPTNDIWPFNNPDLRRIQNKIYPQRASQDFIYTESNMNISVAFEGICILYR